MKSRSLLALLGLIGIGLVASAGYYLWRQALNSAPISSMPSVSTTSSEPPFVKPPTPAFPEPEEPVASGGKPRLRWVGPGEGIWEDPQNWEDEGDKTHRLPGPNDDLLIPERVGARTVRILITDGAPKRVRSLVNRGILRGVVSEKNPTGSVVLEVEGELINYRRIESADVRGSEPSAVILKAQRLRNEYAIEAGRTESTGPSGGRVEIAVDVLENRDEISGGDAWGGQGGSVLITARLVHNMGTIRGGRGGQHAQSPPAPGGDVILTATEEINHYEGQIEGGRSFSSVGGSVRLEAPKIHHLGGVIRASDGVAQGGSVVLRATRVLLISGTKTSVTGYQIALSAPEVNIHGLESKGVQARATIESIKITACEKLNLSATKNKGIFDLPKEGVLSIYVPSESAIVLDRGISLESLSTVSPQILSGGGSCP
ncbi:MAG: hypothetical protein RML48_02605 [Candidatus Bipolaricaulota bacterium]|nr:hypothetical protein [Candidatus Bipolaricaulota bacterium]